MGGKGDLFGGKNHIKMYEKDPLKTIKFNDVAGLQSAKDEVVEFVEFLKNPQKY